MDVILTGTDLVPEFGQAEKLVDSGVLTVGSSSVISACGAARLGLRTGFVGVVGEDELGHFVLDAMASRGVDVSNCLHHPTVQTGVSVLLTPSGSSQRRAILTAPGTMCSLKADHVDLALLARTRHVHCGGYFLQPGLRPGLPALFSRARQSGVTCSVDPNWDPENRWNGHLEAVLKECDIFFPNETEAQRIARQAEVEGAIQKVAPGVPTVAVKQGERGASVRWEGRILHGDAPEVDVVDTTGAGDSFNAGFLYGYLHQWSPEEMLKIALACGSLSTRGIGGVDTQPDLHTALSLSRGIKVWEEGVEKSVTDR